MAARWRSARSSICRESIDVASPAQSRSYSWRMEQRRRRALPVLAGAVAVAAVVAALSVARSEPPPVVVPPEPTDVFDPVAAGEPLPDGYRDLRLGRDQILPVYNPEFVSAAEVDWPAEMLVIGVAGSSTAKAYPVTHLNQREMVIDWLDGSPILVSW